MARVTVEDCITRIPNRFELVALASRRAKAIAAGAPLTVYRDNDKDTVVALREIADQTVNTDQLREELVQHYQRRQPVEKLAESGAEEMVDAEVAEAMKADIEAMDSAAVDKPDIEEMDGMSFDEQNLDVED